MPNHWLLFFKSHLIHGEGEKERFRTWPKKHPHFFRIGQSLSTSLWALLRAMAEGYQVQAGPEDCWDWRWARPFPEGLGRLFHCTRDNCWSGLWHITEPHVQQAWSQNLCALGWSIQKWDHAGINHERTLGCHHWRRLPLTKSHDLHDVCFVAIGEAWRSLHHRALEVQNLVLCFQPLDLTHQIDLDRFFDYLILLKFIVILLILVNVTQISQALFRDLFLLVWWYQKWSYCIFDIFCRSVLFSSTYPALKEDLETNYWFHGKELYDYRVTHTHWNWNHGEVLGDKDTWADTWFLQFLRQIQELWQLWDVMNYMYFSREVKRVRSALNYSSGRPVFPMFVAARGMISSAALGAKFFQRKLHDWGICKWQ